MKLVLGVAISLVFLNLARADEAETSWKFAGSVGAAIRNQDAVLTFGGPKLLVSSGELSASAGFFPSLLYMEGQSPSFRPSLGFGPEFSFKKVGVIVPFYFVRNHTVPFFGFSMKF